MNLTRGFQGRVPVGLVHDYYNLQGGGGVGTVFVGQRFQRGHGLGSFFDGLFRSAMPLITRGLQALGRQALSSGGEVLDDVMHGQPLRESFVSRTRDGAQILGGKLKLKLDEFQSGSGAKRLTQGDSTSYMLAGTRKHPQFFARQSRGRQGQSRRGDRVRKKEGKPRKKHQQKKKKQKKQKQKKQKQKKKEKKEKKQQQKKKKKDV